MVKVVFLHPDLGIGGAERLVVDAGLALKQKGHEVHFVTSHHDPAHCFSETLSELPVTVAGDWLPRSVLGRFQALCAYVRMIYAALYVILFSGLKPDVVFCDQVSACVPVLKLFSKAKVIFYCHFPDQLLSPPGGRLKKLYRAPLNWLEQTTTGQADLVLVNSNFTARVFKETFPRLQVRPRVLYPSLNTSFFDMELRGHVREVVGCDLPPYLFLSVNRFERKKNLPLALNAMAELRTLLSEEEWAQVFLVLAGGYDGRIDENIEHYEELRHLMMTLKLEDKVKLLRSPSDDAKLILLRSSRCLLYTPANEHFGIVPLEAMYVGRPVVAADSGGPTETILHMKTGVLCSPEPKEFAMAMADCFREGGEGMGRKGRERVKEHFSFDAFADQLDSCVKDVRKEKEKSS